MVTMRVKKAGSGMKLAISKSEIQKINYLSVIGNRVILDFFASEVRFGQGARELMTLSEDRQTWRSDPRNYHEYNRIRAEVFEDALRRERRASEELRERLELDLRKARSDLTGALAAADSANAKLALLTRKRRRSKGRK